MKHLSQQFFALLIILSSFCHVYAGDIGKCEGPDRFGHYWKSYMCGSFVASKCISGPCRGHIMATKYTPQIGTQYYDSMVPLSADEAHDLYNSLSRQYRLQLAIELMGK